MSLRQHTLPQTEPQAVSLLACSVVLGLYWLQLFYQLQVEWSANEQYSYGWFAPLLAAVLLWRRWQGWSQASHTGRSTRAQGPRSVVGGWWPVALLLGLLLPLRLVHEANIGWRSAQWLHACILVLLTLLVLWHAAGWAAVRHFAFPVVFLLVAVPWPNRVETPVVQGLMRVVAAVTVEVVDLLNIPSMQRGNLIETSAGVLSVDGACSGVRSIQTSLMVALLVGEVFRLRLEWRIALVPFGLLTAFVANVGRTSLLTWSAARQGLAGMERLHAPAGVAVVAVIFAALYCVARFMARQRPPTATNPAPRAPEHRPTSIAGAQPATGSSTNRLFISPVLNRHGLLVALAWLCFTEVATAVWFYLGDRRTASNGEWSVRWPTEAASYRAKTLSRLERAVLRYDTAGCASWRDHDGNLWSVIALWWAANNKHSFIGRGHTPDSCFTGAGWRLRAEPPPVRLSVNGIDLPFRRYLFEVDGRSAYVYLALWDERSHVARQELPLDYGIINRLKSAVVGKRHQGLKKLEISITGPGSDEEALAVLQRGLQELLLPEIQPGKVTPEAAGDPVLRRTVETRVL